MSVDTQITEVAMLRTLVKRVGQPANREVIEKESPQSGPIINFHLIPTAITLLYR
jgi:hypothetical protein